MENDRKFYKHMFTVVQVTVHNISDTLVIGYQCFQFTCISGVFLKVWVFFPVSLIAVSLCRFQPFCQVLGVEWVQQTTVTMNTLRNACRSCLLRDQVQYGNRDGCFKTHTDPAVQGMVVSQPSGRLTLLISHLPKTLSATIPLGFALLWREIWG